MTSLDIAPINNFISHCVPSIMQRDDWTMVLCHLVSTLWSSWVICQICSRIEVFYYWYFSLPLSCDCDKFECHGCCSCSCSFCCCCWSTQRFNTAKEWLKCSSSSYRQHKSLQNDTEAFSLTFMIDLHFSPPLHISTILLSSPIQGGSEPFHTPASRCLHCANIPQRTDRAHAVPLRLLLPQVSCRLYL